MRIAHIATTISLNQIVLNQMVYQKQKGHEVVAIDAGKGGEVASNRLEDQEVLVHALHLLQSCPVYVNTLMLQRVLAEPVWMARNDAGRHSGPDAARLEPCEPLWRLRSRYGATA